MQAKVRKLPYYLDPEQIFSHYHKEPMAVFLDSSLANNLGQYSIIGLRPYKTLEEKDGVCWINQVPVEGDFLSHLQNALNQISQENKFHLPLISGSIGYFSYDFGRQFENLQSCHPRRSHLCDALFCFYQVLIIADLKNQELYLSIIEEDKTLEERLFGEFAHSLHMLRNDARTVPKKHSGQAYFQADFTHPGYGQAIEQMRTYMQEGHIYVANMTQQLQVQSEKTPYEVFRYLRRHNPSPFGAYMNYKDYQVICASPERFLQMKEKKITTRPIKGTRKRGNTPEEDQSMRQELEASPKDHSELLMIMDLERNDLNRICIPGSVQVTEPFVIEAYATVFHLVSEITGQLKPDYTPTDLIRSTFPGGSITGAPKIRAMEIIDELEHHRRELYTGSIGYFSSDGNCDFNIVIRTAVYEDHIYTLGVGGGITYESDVEFEYEETLQKARAVLEAIYD